MKFHLTVAFIALSLLVEIHGRTVSSEDSDSSSSSEESSSIHSTKSSSQIVSSKNYGTSGYKGGSSGSKSLTSEFSSSITLIKRNSGETDKAYCERAFVQNSGESEHDYYKRILTKSLEESDAEYVTRCDLIKSTLTNIKVFKDDKYSDLVENYYNLKYKRTDAEGEQEYVKRLLTKESNEDGNTYRERITVLKGLYSNLDCWKTFKFDEKSSSGYKLISTKTSEKKSSNTKTDGTKKESTLKKRSEDTKTNKVEAVKSIVTFIKRNSGETDKAYCERAFVQNSGESEHDYYKRILTKSLEESDAEYVTRCDLIKSTLTNIKVFKDDKYSDLVENYYNLKYKRTDAEGEQEYVKRLLTKESNEDGNTYKERITVLKGLYSNLDCWKTFEFDEKSSSGYKLISTKTSEKKSSNTKTDGTKKESTLKKRSEDTKTNKVEAVKSIVTFIKRNSGETDKAYCERAFVQNSGESEHDYYKRILTKSLEESDAEYVTRCDLIKSTLTNIKVFKDDKYSDLVENYYNLKYKRTDAEGEQEYVKRLLTKESNEDGNTYKERITVLKGLYSNLDCWKTFEFDEKSSSGYKLISTKTSEKKSSNTKTDGTKKESTLKKRSEDTKTNKVEAVKSIVTFIKRNSGETDKAYCERAFVQNSGESEHDYYKRILTKSLEESDAEYVTRCDLIKSTLTNIKVFKDDKYSDLVENYYNLKYKRTDTEGEQEYIKRLLTKESNEDGNTYKERITVLKGLYSNLDCWKTFEFDEKSSSGYKLISTKTSEKKSSNTKTDGTKKESTLIKRSVDTKTKKADAVNSIVTFVKRNSGETDKAYCERAFVQNSGESEHDYYKRILTKSLEESDAEYVTRCDLIKSTLTNIKVFKDDKYSDLVENYYNLKYKRTDTEGEQEYIKRLLTKESNEDGNTYKERITVLKSLYSKLDCWKTFEFDEKSSSGYKLISTKTSKKKSSNTKTDGTKKESTLKKRSEDTKTNKVEAVKSIVTFVKRNSGETDKAYCERAFVQNSGESEHDYYKRILTKSLEESDAEYVTRCDLIKSTLTNIKVFKDDKYSDLVENYYNLKYKRTDAEGEQEYIKRLLTKESNEDGNTYKERITVLKSLYSKLDCWKTFEFDEKSHSGYKLISTKTSEKKSSNTKTDSGSVSEPPLMSSSEKKEESSVKKRSVDKSGKATVTAKKVKTDSTATEKTKTDGKKEESSTQKSNVSTVTVVKRNTGETDKEYCERAFAQNSGESEQEYYKRILTRSIDETDIEYVNRCELIKSTLTNIKVFKDEKYSDLIKTYYKLKYTKIDSESEQEYIQRLLKKESNEDSKTYKERITVLKSLFSYLDCWKTFEFDEKSSNGYKVISISEKKSTTNSGNKKGLVATQKHSLSSVTFVKRNSGETDKEYCERAFVQNSGESEQDYYERILTRSLEETDVEYIKRCDLIKSTLSNIKVFKNDKYSYLLENYYKLKYTKIDSESEQEYIQRLFTKESNEDTKMYEERIIILKKLYSGLDCWKTFEFDEKSSSGYRVISTTTSGKENSTTTSETTATKSNVLKTSGNKMALHKHRSLTTEKSSTTTNKQNANSDSSSSSSSDSDESDSSD